MSFDYLKASFDRAQRDYERQLPPEHPQGDGDGGGIEKEFDKAEWKADIERDDH